ncbi:hypothetical protein KPATCC21470_5480 [Kitasatospora purpeofusca]
MVQCSAARGRREIHQVPVPLRGRRPCRHTEVAVTMRHDEGVRGEC